MKLVNVTVSVPLGLRLEAHVPESSDPELITVIFKSILGGLAAIDYIKDEESKRAFLVRYAASIVNETNGLAHSSQLSNEFNEDDSVEKIVEELLKSLHKRS